MIKSFIALPINNLIRVPPNQANALTPDKLKKHSFFSEFDYKSLYSDEGSYLAYNPDNRNRILTEAIPALSFAAGRNEIQGFYDRNTDLMTFQINGWPAGRNTADRWLHSDFVDVAYTYNYAFYLEIAGVLK